MHRMSSARAGTLRWSLERGPERTEAAATAPVTAVAQPATLW